MTSTLYDLAILGSGPGGYVAALRASQLGMKVAIVEKENLGGVCLNWGCIPTKALLESAELISLIKSAPNYGLNALKPSFEMASIVSRSRSVVEKLTFGIKGLLAKSKVETFFGEGEFTSSNSVRIKSSGDEIRAKKTIVATGARPRALKGFNFDGKRIWSYRDAIVAPSVPESITIIGGGVIGLEFASMYNSLGSKVKILEACSRIIPNEDADISQFISKAFAEKGIEVLCGVELLGCNVESGLLEVQFKHLGKVCTGTAEKILVSVGVVPNSDNLGLEFTKVETDRGIIKTDSYLKTSDPSIYAIGDVTYGPWLAHKATKEALICVENIAGLSVEPLNRSRIPSCIYCSPQCASVGMSEEIARKSVGEIKVGRFPLHANGKALAAGYSEGFVKTIFDSKSGELLGAHFAGHGVTELIHSASIAMQLETTELELLNAVFPHPTLSEAFQESILDAIGRPIHK